MAAFALITAFLLVRLVFLVIKEPFYDELFTMWMASKPLDEILPALRLDSGPPLYYLVARFTDLAALRLVSLAFSTAIFIALILQRALGNARFVAAALLVAYPPAVIYAGDARAYAMAGALIGAAVLLLEARRPFAAAASLVVAAYSHFLAILFFPLLLLRGRRGGAAFAAAGVAFVPGLLLALSQPAEAMAWQPDDHWLSPLLSLAYVGDYPASLLMPPPMVLIVLAAVVTLIAIARSWRFAPYVLIPIAAAVVLGVAGRDVYTPLRFESLLAVPFVLWMSDSLRRWPRKVGVAIGVLLVLAGGITLARGAADFYRGGQNYTSAGVTLAAKIAGPDEPLVVSGYYVLPAAVTLDRPFLALPREQLAHPGWRARLSPQQIAEEVERLPASAFVLLGDAAQGEVRAVARARGGRVLHRSGNTVILRVPAAR